MKRLLHCPSIQIHDLHHGVVLTSHERGFVSGIERNAMRTLAAGKRHARYHSIGNGIDGDELTLSLNTCIDEMRSSIKLCVPYLAAEGNRVDSSIAVRVDDGVGPSDLVRDKQLVV